MEAVCFAWKHDGGSLSFLFDCAPQHECNSVFDILLMCLHDRAFAWLDSETLSVLSQ